MTTATSTATALTPSELAALWGVSPEQIIKLIRKGAMRGFDVSLPGSKRPRFRINLSEIIAYEERRSARQPVTSVRRKRKKQAADFVTYFQEWMRTNEHGSNGIESVPLRTIASGHGIAHGSCRPN